jgi:hypothetical protein
MHIESYYKQNRKQSSALQNDIWFSVLNELVRTKKAATAGIMTYGMILCQFLLEDLSKR